MFSYSRNVETWMNVSSDKDMPNWVALSTVIQVYKNAFGKTCLLLTTGNVISSDYTVEDIMNGVCGKSDANNSKSN